MEVQLYDVALQAATQVGQGGSGPLCGRCGVAPSVTCIVASVVVPVVWLVWSYLWCGCTCNVASGFVPPWLWTHR